MKTSKAFPAVVFLPENGLGFLSNVRFRKQREWVQALFPLSARCQKARFLWIGFGECIPFSDPPDCLFLQRIKERQKDHLSSFCLMKCIVLLVFRQRT